MSSITSPEGLNRSRPFNANPSKEALGTVCGTIYSSASVFRFLAETFGAVNATDVDLTLSSDAAAGLAHMCEKVGEELINAYGIMPL